MNIQSSSIVDTSRFCFPVAVLVLSLAVMATTDANETTRIESKPNIVLIFTDDQGMNDVGCYGSEIPTPNIDSIVETGWPCGKDRGSTFRHPWTGSGFSTSKAIQRKQST